MRKTLADIRLGALQWVNDPSGDLFAPNQSFARLDALINESYQTIVNECSLIPQPFNVCTDAEAITVTVATDQREYTLTPTDPMARIGRVIQVFEDFGEFRREEIPLIPWTLRERGGNGVYAYRSSLGVWRLGLQRMPPQFTTLLVFWRQALLPLTVLSEIPLAVPEEHHEVIIYLTALRGLLQENREPGAVATLYNDSLDRMRQDLSNLDTGMTVERL